MTTSKSWQLASEAALRYEEILVPTILGPAADALVEAVPIAAGDRVLDVGCGTGAATRPAARKAGPAGRVVGLDVNAGMLECARASVGGSGARVELREGSALELPFDAGSFDVALCAQTLQFLPDRARAVAEMLRVLRPGGTFGISTWAALDRQPYFHSLVEATARQIGPDTAAALGAAFGLAHPDELALLLTSAGAGDVDVREVRLDLALAPLDEFVPRHITATPMAAGFERAPVAARLAVTGSVLEDLESYRTATGAVVPFNPLIATGVATAGHT